MRWVYLVGAIGILGTYLGDTWLHVNYQLAANTSLIYVAFFTTAFVLLYGVRSNWRGNRVGKIFFAKAIVLPVMLWQLVAAAWWDVDYPFRQQVRFGIYSLAAMAYLAMVVALWREQHSDRNDAP